MMSIKIWVRKVWLRERRERLRYANISSSRSSKVELNAETTWTRLKARVHVFTVFYLATLHRPSNEAVPTHPPPRPSTLSLQLQAHQLSVGYQPPPHLCHHPCAKSVGARQPRLFSGRNWTIRICRLKSKKKQSTLSTLRGYSTVPITKLALEKTARSSTCFGTFQ